MNLRMKHDPNRLGATLIVMIGVLVLIVGIAAFMVDISRMQLVRSQLQTAVDAGAIAGSLQLKLDPGDSKAAKDVAEQFVQLNRVGFMVTVPEKSIKVDVGNWDVATGSFNTPSGEKNAIQVLATQKNEPYLFGGIFGKSTFSMPGQSVAVSGPEDLDIVMVLDLSGSMGSDGRIEALRAAVPVFVDVIEERDRDDEIGVMGYGARLGSYDPASEGHSGVHYNATPAALFPSGEDPATDWAGILEHPLTDDFDTLRNSVLNASSLVDGKYGGGTPIGASLRDGAHYLDNNSRDGTAKFVVLMSDGEANKPSSYPSQYALQMGSYASGMGIRVYTISLGNSADVGLMNDIANASGGKHFEAAGSGSTLTENLENAFRSVAGDISKTTIVQ